MKNFVVTLSLIALATIAVLLLRPGSERGAPDGRGAQAVTGLPWQIETLADGSSRVFGLQLGHSTFGDARERFGTDMEVGVVAAPGETGALEAYYDEVTAGAVTGKLILAAAMDKETVERLREHAPNFKYMDSATKKFILHPDDLALAWRAPIAAITFIPSVHLDEEIALQRFGTPRERIRAGEHVEHLLYPDKGLDLVLDSKGKEVLQYVSPREFARVRDPLLHATPAKDNH